MGGQDRSCQITNAADDGRHIVPGIFAPAFSSRNASSRVHEYDVHGARGYATDVAPAWTHTAYGDVARQVPSYPHLGPYNSWTDNSHYGKYRSGPDPAAWPNISIDPLDQEPALLQQPRKKKRKATNVKPQLPSFRPEDDVHSVSTGPGADSPTQADMQAAMTATSPAFNWMNDSFGGSFALFGDACGPTVGQGDLGGMCWDLPAVDVFPDCVSDHQSGRDVLNPYQDATPKADASLDVWKEGEAVAAQVEPLMASTPQSVCENSSAVGGLLDRSVGVSSMNQVADVSPPAVGACDSVEMSAQGHMQATNEPMSRSRERKRSSRRGSDDGDADSNPPRPELTEAMLNQLVDISEFRNNEKYAKHIVPYEEGISFPLGEGGRELLRACLNVRGCKGRQLQGASVPSLLQLAQAWQLWDVAIRIKVERSVGQLCPTHEAFVKFKATQSAQRKFVKKEYMLTERDPTGKIAKILYDENRKIILGKEGRETLRALLRRQHEKEAAQMDRVLSEHGFKYSELRNATVQQLSRMAFVCNLWDKVESACRNQEEKRDGKGRTRRPGDASPAMMPTVDEGHADRHSGDSHLDLSAPQTSDGASSSTQVGEDSQHSLYDPSSMLPGRGQNDGGAGGAVDAEFVNIFDHNGLPDLLGGPGGSEAADHQALLNSEHLQAGAGLSLADDPAGYFQLQGGVDGSAGGPVMDPGSWGALQWQA